MLTTASCLEDLNSTDIWAGTDEIGPGYEDKRQVQQGYEFFIHESYDPSRPGEHNIALIKLDEPFKYNGEMNSN